MLGVLTEEGGIVALEHVRGPQLLALVMAKSANDPKVISIHANIRRPSNA